MAQLAPSSSSLCGSTTLRKFCYTVQSSPRYTPTGSANGLSPPLMHRCPTRRRPPTWRVIRDRLVAPPKHSPVRGYDFSDGHLFKRLPRIVSLSSIGLPGRRSEEACLVSKRTAGLRLLA